MQLICAEAHRSSASLRSATPDEPLSSLVSTLFKTNYYIHHLLVSCIGCLLLATKYIVHFLISQIFTKVSRKTK